MYQLTDRRGSSLPNLHCSRKASLVNQQRMTFPTTKSDKEKKRKEKKKKEIKRNKKK
jgi:hypothetical protein